MLVQNTSSEDCYYVAQHLFLTNHLLYLILVRVYAYILDCIKLLLFCFICTNWYDTSDTVWQQAQPLLHSIDLFNVSVCTINALTITTVTISKLIQKMLSCKFSRAQAIY